MVKYYCDRCGIECKNKGNKLSIEMESFKNIDKILCNGCHYELKDKLDDYLIGRTEYYYKATKSK